MTLLYRCLRGDVVDDAKPHCPRCHGAHKMGDCTLCVECKGTGKVEIKALWQGKMQVSGTRPCPACKGTKRVVK